ncbi:high mobility group B protein 6 isoform X2 [Amborella trichopoda]|uniref:high mobility group B protein 6 isoform X2 n=1 Tax=Amborella trichopoda TaxID=13333 RepID=UPI0009BC8F68|nr:high mobility group B protein 6 isoform X2 [Amborella trichopoda]|eukprot:XP_011620633.2 high mobility group B protein 6 isoform X2 [Amborella trichopoda]
MATVVAEPEPVRQRKSRKPLKPKNENDNILLNSPSFAESEKENLVHPSMAPKVSQPNKKKSKHKSVEEELKEVREKLEKMRLEKEKADEILKEKDELLKQKAEEIETRGKAQEKLESEIKKLQKQKAFKPNLSLPIVQAQPTKEKEKKPNPPYILWCKEHWNQVVGTKKREEDALKLYQEEQNQKAALELLQQFLQFKQDEEDKKGKKKKEKDPEKPKQPLSAFFIFSKERRAALPSENKNILEDAKIAGEEWKKMTKEMRAPYEEAAKKEKEKYLKEMDLYKQKKHEEAATLKNEEEEQLKVQKQEALQLLKKKEKSDNIIKRAKKSSKKKQQKELVPDSNKPKKPATSFFLFNKETRKLLLQDRPGINNSTLNALISVKWKELNDEERQIWVNRAAEAMAAYKEHMKSVDETGQNNLAQNQA